MKKNIFTLLLLLALFQIQAQQINVATYNLRYYNKSDTGNLWEQRAPAVVGLIRYHDFDIFGTQEAVKRQLDDIVKALPQYARYGKGRNNGGDEGEHAAIFYKKDKFELLHSGDFWLSQTPDKPGLGWDATCCNRICSWIYVRDKKSGKKFYFFNVHFDHQGKIAQVESGKLMLKKIVEIAKNETVILTGDFNGDRNSDWYNRLAHASILKDSYKDVKYPYENNASFNGFKKQLTGNEVIDHIFISKSLKAIKWGVLTDTYYGKFPSDHFPVQAVLSFQ